MPEHEHLTLRLVRLQRSEAWTHEGKGLSFVFSKGGAGKYLSRSVERPLASGDVLVLNGATGVKLGVGAPEELIFWWFSACVEHMFPLLASTEICLLQNVIHDFGDAKLYPASTPLAKECHSLLQRVPPQADLGHRGHMLRVAAAILAEEFKAAHTRRVGYIRPEEHLMQVFENLSTTEILGLSVGELAAKFGCSRRHLNRLFHQHFGFSVAALRMEMRLLKAVSLLRDPDAKVINVAEECGFNHLGLFNTCFKRRFGASPGQYRKIGVPAATPPGSPARAESCPLQANGLCPWTGGPGTVPAAPPEVLQAPKEKPATRPAARTGGARQEAAPRIASIQQKFAGNLPRASASQAGS